MTLKSGASMNPTFPTRKNRLPRDLPSLKSVLDALDRYSLAAKRPVTLPLVREALERKFR